MTTAPDVGHPLNRPDIDIDTQTGATYIHLTNLPIAATREAHLPGVTGVSITVDVDAAGRAVGVEIL